MRCIYKGHQLTLIQGSAGRVTTNGDPGLQYTDPNQMDWTLFDNGDWLWDFDNNIPMPGTNMLG
jgi:hypothetical protein